jgi:hypothetical protein
MEGEEEDVTGEVRRFHADEVALDTLAQPDDSFAGDVLAQEMFFHAFDGLDKVFFGERLSAYDVAEKSSYCA